MSSVINGYSKKSPLSFEAGFLKRGNQPLFKRLIAQSLAAAVALAGIGNLDA